MQGRTHEVIARGLLKTALLVTVSMTVMNAAQAQEVKVDPATTGTAGTAAPETASPDAVNAAATQAGEAGGLADIVVTARRDAENVQRVPVSIQVVTGDTLRKLQITQPDEVSKLAPGLTLANPTTGDGAITLRGVRWSAGSGPAATPVYLNESIFNPGYALQSLYDIGQIEVLRGPQGTRRGAPSISGAITITTRRPVLNKFGGYVQAFAGTGDHYNLQGAINVPVIDDILAIRIAGSIENSQGNTVRSVNSRLDPLIKLRNYRVTAYLKPTDTIDVVAMFQRQRTTGRSFTQVIGSGSAGNPALGIPAGFNGPRLTAQDYRAVADEPNPLGGGVNLFTLNTSWEVAGQLLSYNFSRARSINGPGRSPTDVGNTLIGYEPFQTSRASEIDTMHELRISSRRGAHFFDYDIGYYNFKTGGDPLVVQPQVYLAGAFGRPGLAAAGVIPGGASPGDVRTPLARYTLPVTASFNLRQRDESFYGNVQFHLPYDFELTGGLRRLRAALPVSLGVQTGSAFIVALANPAAAFGLSCEALGAGLVTSVYAGLCDASIPASPNSVQNFAGKSKETLYNVSLSKRFGNNLLVYATTGTSFRPGYPAIGQSGLPADLAVPNPEKATSYEIGVKSTIAPWLRINADIFQINYDGQLVAFPGVQYYNSASGRTEVTGVAFFDNLDSRSRGIELEIYTKPFDRVSLNALVSYAKIQSRGGLVPAAVGSCSGAVAVSAANPINLCPSERGRTLNTSAPFQASVNGSYDIPLGGVNGYVRFNTNYQGRSPNFQTSFQTNNVDFRPTKAYALVDLFAGVTDAGGAWDIGVYAKNLFDTKVLLTAQPINTIYAGFGDPGYQSANATARREVGLSARYSFGSR
ncbi:MAG TPA: TonB-dependent receptor plug domain-containing protein [Sphingobium sp.]|uniref:TonB-dependent receptor n=1 Tax=Sphingobium sp. TaxID=1912891 RepID=UPI002ED1634C